MIHGDSKAKTFCIASLIFVAAVLSFSSCIDLDDTNKSIVLSGEWRGDFGMFYDYKDNYGRIYTFESYDTYLTFTPAYSYARYGRGTQVDYYAQGPYEFQYYKFSWEINNGAIFLTYDYDSQLNTLITKYSITNDYFSGTFSETGTTFRMRKLVDYYNWAPYVNNYGYWYRDGWDYDYPYYAPATRSEDNAPADTTATAGEVLRRGRR